MASLKELSKKSEILTAGHRLCAGCGAPIAIRQVLMASDKPVIVGFATGCVEVATTIYPFTAWRCPWIHNAFENVCATVSGVETAYRALKKKGKIADEINFVAFGGDGGMYDIGLQSLSGALERGHRMLSVCYDNEGYMNTGAQRSSATPKGAATTTTPAGKASSGKQQFRKDLAAVVAAHKIPYVATACPSYWNDLITKAKKAFSVDGPSFMNILAPCPRGWRFKESQTVEVGKLAVETCFWPLYEVENGTTWRITYTPKQIRPLSDWTSMQGRFAHLNTAQNKHILDELQEQVKKDWEELIRKSEKKTDQLPSQP